MAITGLGVDWTRVERMRRELARPGFGFRDSVFTQTEIDDAEQAPNPTARYAAAFAAKEATLKALGSGLREGLGWHQVEIIDRDRREPMLRLSGEAAHRAKGRRAHLAIAHTREHACATVVLESAQSEDVR